MANVFACDKVLYVCTCGSKKPITKVYYCRHCSQLRCGDCVSHEVDSHYCPNCLEYMPSPEAKLKKNRCANCFDCPSCMHTLSTRATTVQVASQDDPSKSVPKKVYYLTCGFCRWTSRDVKIPDQTAASGGWPENENIHSKRINALLEHYRMLAQREKLDRERRKFSQRCSSLYFLDKYYVSSIVARKLAGLGLPPSAGGKDAETKCGDELIPAETVDEGEPLPNDIFHQTVNLSQVCTISQRLMQPEIQPTSASKLCPRRKHLLVKRSQRCRECEHNLSKPEYNPSSIKFKIQLAAFYHIPEVCIKNVPPLIPSQENCIELTLCNPTPYIMHIGFLSTEMNKLNDIHVAKVVLPDSELTLAARDDTAEFDDSGNGSDYADDPQVVTFRKANKLGFLIKVVPENKDGEVKVAFNMKHDFVNMVVQLQGDQREPQVVWLSHCVILSLGLVQKE